MVARYCVAAIVGLLLPMMQPLLLLPRSLLPQAAVGNRRYLSETVSSL